METLSQTHFSIPGARLYRGKVRDVYTLQNDRILMVATDRISAFDVILPRPIPYKGQILNRIATHFLEQTRSIVPNWLEQSPHPNVSLGKRCTPIPLEFVIRGYLSGHAWRCYRDGQRTICGVTMPDGLNQNDPFPEPILTPATKAASGHDEDISREEILRQGILSQDQWDQLAQLTRALFRHGTEQAQQRDLILVDTKYEFGYYDGKIMLIDEIHTPDSSRYFYAEGYQARQERGEPQTQLSKEFVREWLMENDFQGQEGQHVPEMSDEVVQMIYDRYRSLYAQLMGEAFVPASLHDLETRTLVRLERS